MFSGPVIQLDYSEYAVRPNRKKPVETGKFKMAASKLELLIYQLMHKIVDRYFNLTIL